MENNISFARLVKEEIALNEYYSIPRLKAILSAYIKISSSVTFKNKRTGILLRSENAKIAKFFYENINKLYNVKAHIEYQKKSKLNRHTTYLVTLDDAEDILSDLNVSFLEGKIPHEIVYDDDTISGYLAGAFLASGSINSPKTSNYHLEIALSFENYAKWLSKLFAKYKNSNIEPKIIKRRDKYVIYFKKGDQISSFLVMIGAVNSAMEFEDARMSRDLINNSNRLVNIDTANMSKIVKTGSRQKREILIIDKRLGINNLKNIKAQKLARLRLENESASLDDLAELLSEEMETPITKSNINHLFRYMHEVYLKVSK